MDAITIENANKIRASMGLAPLPSPATNNLSFKDKTGPAEELDTISTLERREAAAGDNWQKLENDRRAATESQARKDAAKKQRDLEQRHRALVGKGLGDDDDEELDTRTWLLQQRKRQKKVDELVQKQTDAADAEREKAKNAAYSSADLAGIKVGHQADAFNDGAEQILTLRDAEIGDEDQEDELEAAELLEKEVLQKRLDLKRKKPVYDPTEMENDGERSLLKQYDDEDETRKRQRFTLDGTGGGATSLSQSSAANVSSSKGVKISLDALVNDAPVSDYADPATAKIRKPKKSKTKAVRRTRDDDEDGATPAPDMSGITDILKDDMLSRATTQQYEQDEDDLQLQLAQQRRMALKKRTKNNAADLARQLREEAAEQEDKMITTNDIDEEEGGMVIDETTEFVANLKRPDSDDEDDGSKRPRSAHSDDPIEDVDGDMSMADAMNESTEASTSTTLPNAQTSTGIEDEETLDQGVGASLNLLRKRGLLKPTSDNLVAQDRARVQFNAHTQSLVEDYDLRARSDRENDRKSGLFERMSASERDAYQRRQNESRDAYLSTLKARHFAQNYKPNVKLTYTDEFGRDMNRKEAFKHLSHMFHGKGSGKGKTEKKLKKVADEKRVAARSVLDSSAHELGGMQGALGHQARKNNTAGVRLQ